MNIVLIGFMGTGKSETGRLLAKKLCWQFFDTDDMIEREVGMKIPQIFAKHGEPYFREAEAKAIGLVSLLDKTVISCGGGAVTRKENMDELEKNGLVICLTASPEVILERTKKNIDRPLLQVKNPLSRIRELLAERRKYYQRCTITIDTTNILPAQVVELILKNPIFPVIAADC